MLIGIDFDNTIVCYDRLFHRLAVERGLVPPVLAPTKQAVRDYLRAISREHEWTELQSIAYGPRIEEAEPFPGVQHFLQLCHETDVKVAIVSHKTRYPYRGEKHDLHSAAHAFLESRGFYQNCQTGLSPDRVYFESTLNAKLERIGLLGCDEFIDDLPEVLLDKAFPSEVRKVLFDPAGVHTVDSVYTRVTAWIDCRGLLLNRREVLA